MCNLCVTVHHIVWSIVHKIDKLNKNSSEQLIVIFNVIWCINPSEKLCFLAAILQHF